MATYYHKKSLYKNLTRWQKTHNLALTSLVAFMVIATGLGVYLWQQFSPDPGPQKIEPVKLGAYAGTPQIEYINEQFSFKSVKEWLYIRESSIPPHKYVYYNHINNITQYEITVYVDNIPSQPVGYITPVSVQDSRLVPDLTSPRCGQDIKNGNGYVPMVYQEVSYQCDLVNSQEKIAAGIKRGSYSIPMYDSEGKLKHIGVYFTDHSPGYRPEIFNEILSSLKLR